MRTTIRIDDDLYRRLKALAATTGRTVAAVIEDTLRRGLLRPASTEAHAQMPTYGAGGLLPGIDLSDNAAVRQVMDQDEPLDALR